MDTGVQLRRQFGDGLPQVLIDRELIKQALLNLFTNSRQAMPDGGELMVRTSTPGDRVRIDVIDTGIGMSQEALGRVFELYFSTKTMGTGLGLPTVRRIVGAAETDGYRMQSFILAVATSDPFRRSRAEDQMSSSEAGANGSQTAGRR